MPSRENTLRQLLGLPRNARMQEKNVPWWQHYHQGLVAFGTELFERWAVLAAVQRLASVSNQTGWNMVGSFIYIVSAS